MLVLLVAIIYLGIVTASRSCLPLVINVSTPVHITGPYFASWTIDPSRNRLFFDVNFSDPRLQYLAREIGGTGLIRFGGGGADSLTYGGFGGLPSCDSPQPYEYECLNKSTLDALVALSNYSGNRLIFGLDIVPLGGPPPGPPTGPWDPTAARGVLEYLRDAQAPLFGVELGNERNHHGFTPAQQSACFDALSELLREIWPAPLRPALIGPDADGAGNGPPGEMITYLAQFVQLQGGGGALSAMTHHEYLQVDSTSVLNASYLDHTGEIAQAVVSGVRAVSPSLPIWAGEIGPHTGNSAGNGSAGNCSDNKLCGRFGSSIWYADSMSAKARAGYDAYFRQDLVGASYALVNTSIPTLPPPASFVGGFSPSSDYYLLYLWKRLVGARVLDVSTAAGGVEPTTRAYAFCTLSSWQPPSGGGGASPPSVTLILINIDPLATACLAIPSFVPPSASLTYFTLTAGEAGEGVQSWGVRLNGKLLQLTANGTLPDLSGKVVPAGQEGGIFLPPLSVSFVVVPGGGALSAC